MKIEELKKCWIRSTVYLTQLPVFSSNKKRCYTGRSFKPSSVFWLIAPCNTTQGNFYPCRDGCYYCFSCWWWSATFWKLLASNGSPCSPGPSKFRNSPGTTILAPCRTLCPRMIALASDWFLNLLNLPTQPFQAERPFLLLTDSQLRAFAAQPMKNHQCKLTSMSLSHFASRSLLVFSVTVMHTCHHGDVCKHSIPLLGHRCHWTSSCCWQDKPL